MLTYALKCEDAAPALMLNGNFSLINLAGAPATIIKNDEGWQVKFSFTASGTLTSFINGKYRLAVYLQKLDGGGFELPGNSIIVQMQPSITPVTYNHVISFAPNVVPAGSYRLFVAITIKDLFGNPGPATCYGEGSILQFYNPS